MPNRRTHRASERGETLVELLFIFLMFLMLLPVAIPLCQIPGLDSICRNASSGSVGLAAIFCFIPDYDQKRPRFFSLILFFGWLAIAYIVRHLLFAYLDAPLTFILGFLVVPWSCILFKFFKMAQKENKRNRERD